MNRLAGVGLKNLIVIAMFTMLFIVGMKVIMAKYPIAGMSEVVHAV